jgi:acid phosphatase type 7
VSTGTIRALSLILCLLGAGVDLTAAELAEQGGEIHVTDAPPAYEMMPYLQSPTATSLHINWHGRSGLESLVEYGPDAQLGQQAVGETLAFDDQTLWHHVTLEGLSPDTEYFYCCVTDTARSDTLRFRSLPADDVADGHIRFVVYGDSRADPAMHGVVVQSFRDKVVELYGADLHAQLDAVLNVGDIVTTGSTLSQYRDEYFGPIAAISSEVPFMVSIGNHEAEAELYYDYMNYEEFAGAEGEAYYAFRIGPARFIALNSNTEGDTQLAWLADELALAEGDPGTDWIFLFDHHPGHSEIYPDGGRSWVQDEVIPLLAEHDKAAGLFYGHAHNYERGIAPESNLRLLLSGGGGCSLDRWGMHDDQTDYPEIHRAHDYYCYVIFDIDVANRSYSANAYSLGNMNHDMDNELFDSFSRALDLPSPPAPTALTPVEEGSPAPRLTASPYAGEQLLMSSRFQLTTQNGDWSAALVDSTRHWENIHGDTGSPDWLPIDLNTDVDLVRLQLSAGILTLGESYQWRVRYRDRNLGWSNWSARKVFTATDLPDEAEFHGEPRSGDSPLAVRFTDLSRGEALSWSWDLDGDGVADSQERDPVWLYEEGGDWTVSLTTDYGGEQSTVSKVGYITVSTETTVGEGAASATRLMQCKPNPFNPSTEIAFSLARRGTVRLGIFDLRGRRVRRLLDAELAAGTHHRDWNGRNDAGSPLPSGLYLIRLEIAGEVRTEKALLLK